MQDEYREAYLTLFNAVTNALEALRECNYGQATKLLKQGRINAEERFDQGDEDGK